MFFDDILVYSKTLKDHLQHVKYIFQCLRDNKLLIKECKCSFEQRQVEYLRHIISKEGVATDPKNIEAMLNWPTPKTVKSLRGFLGLNGYYIKFIIDYGKISKPLTNMLHKVLSHGMKKLLLLLKN